ncbi:AAA family ATPase [Methylobacillus gramineus]|uniref:ExeA family protein n=1 Tax=Methylobacillus gramineus TaxID=755169 RepID=UPI001D0000E9|nr:AAA family ATPase [Methylobacillus gramineus]MCB5185439.1 AAA family ATPase [Methylobacillus gramineus]
MYYAHFGLKEPPFKITPNTDFFFSGGNRGAVLEALLYAITSGEGIVKVVGEVGSGKTMLCRMLQTMLPPQVESVYLANPSMAPEDVLQAIALELQLVLPANADRLQVMQALQRYLLEKHEAGKHVVVFVEEAQGMPLATLEEIRLLTNLETRHDKLLQIVLFGQPELDENLDQRHIRQLKERITHSFYLGPLQENEIAEYLIFRLRAAGYFGPPLFTKAAIRLLSRTAQGLVRRVNILADKALLSAFAANVYQVDQRHVRAAIQDSEFAAALPPNKRGVNLLLGAACLVLLTVFGSLTWLWLHQPHVDDAQVASSQQPETVVAEAEPIDTSGNIVSDVHHNVLLEDRLASTDAWLEQQSEGGVTIQLMRSEDEDAVNQQLKELTSVLELDNIHAIRTKVESKAFVSVLYGAYSSRQDAATALRLLPESAAAMPQLRTIAGIREEVKQHQ